VVVRLCKVGAGAKWVLSQGGCCYKVSAFAGWVPSQGECSCKVVAAAIGGCYVVTPM